MGHQYFIFVSDLSICIKTVASNTVLSLKSYLPDFKPHPYCKNGDTYAGEYLVDMTYCFGVYQLGNGHWYEGAWFEGRRQELGMYTLRNGEKQAGHWEYGALGCLTEQATRLDSSFSVSHSKVLDIVQQARKASEKAREVVKSGTNQ